MFIFFFILSMFFLSRVFFSGLFILLLFIFNFIGYEVTFLRCDYEQGATKQLEIE